MWLLKLWISVRSHQHENFSFSLCFFPLFFGSSQYMYFKWVSSFFSSFQGWDSNKCFIPLKFNELKLYDAHKYILFFLRPSWTQRIIDKVSFTGQVNARNKWMGSCLFSAESKKLSIESWMGAHTKRKPLLKREKKIIRMSYRISQT